MPVFPEIQRFPSLESTNLRLAQAAKSGAKAGTVVIAEQQSKGKGSAGRNWISPPGGIYLSSLFEIPSMEKAPELSLLAGVAVAQTARGLLPGSVDVSVKWPNDCLLNGKKAAGVLCEVVQKGAQSLAVVGVGINVNLTEEELKQIDAPLFPPSSFALEAGGKQSLEKVIDVFLKKLFKLYESYQAEGFETIRFLWEQNCRLIGKTIRIESPCEVGGETTSSLEGVMQGIDSKGALVVSTFQGEEKHFISGSITRCSWP